MFSPGSLEKSSSTLAENSSPTRGNFAVGINSLGDESQQNIRIQLAVHRYNNSTGSSFIRPINERSVPSPFKHGFLKNTQKFKNCENDKEDINNGLKKSHNQYQDVGNFPVVHLRKNAVIGKPVKRATSSEFKIQLPEIPFNRFLNHSPDICLDTKTSTRSVLDVLQDLSRKRIHTKDDVEASKRKCKGLGGDSPLDFEAPYKPLFVSKSKGSTITYRDSMTQTQEMPQLDSSHSKKNDIQLNSEKDDPKAELRRKLARQNNEIFASLSSSTLSYPLKRSFGKYSAGKDEMKEVEPKAKKSRSAFSDENSGKNIPNGLNLKDSLTAKNCLDQPDKVEKKSKPIDSSKVSPNKDRLTAIFLEMQNVNPKVEVLTQNKSPEEKGKLESSKGVTPNAEKTTVEKSTTPVEGTSEMDKLETNSSLPVSCEASKTVTNANSTSAADSGKITGIKGLSETNIFGSLKENTVTVTKEVAVDEKNNISPVTTTSAAFVLSTTPSKNINFSAESSTNKIAATPKISSSLTRTPILSTGISQKANSTETNSAVVNDDKISNTDGKVQNNCNAQNTFAHSPNQGLMFQTPASGESTDESSNANQKQTNSNLFKFGTGQGSQNQAFPSTQMQPLGIPFHGKDSTPKNAENQPLNDSNSLNVASNGTLVNGFSSEAIQGGSSLAINTTTTTTTTFTQSQQKPSFFTLSNKTSSLGNDATEKSSNSPFNFGQNSTNSCVQSPLFSGAGNNVTSTSKPDIPAAAEEKSLNNNGTNQEKPNQISSTLFTQPGFPANSFSSTAPTFGQNVAISTTQSNQNIMPFKFGGKTDSQNVKPSTENQLSNTSTNLFDNKTQSGVFTFGQKPPTQDGLQPPSSQTAVSQPNLFQSNVFTFGQKCSTPVTSSQNIGNSGIFGQNPSVQTNLFQQNNASQPVSTSNSVLGSNSPFGMSSQANMNENKNQLPSFIQTSSAGISPMNNSFNKTKLDLPNFGASTSSFGQPASSNLPNENIFGSNTSQNTPAFGGSSAVQNNPFAQPFGDNSSKQQNNNNTSSTFFMQQSTTQNSGFGQNTGVNATTFGQNSTGNNIFGQKTQVGGFDQNQNVQSSPFGQNSISRTFGPQVPFTFGSEVPFSFGLPTATSTSSGFALNPTTTGSIFTFGSSTKTTPSTASFGFGTTTRPSSSSQSPFTFSSQPNNNGFKFGSNTGCATGSGTGNFSFDSNPSTSEASKPAANVFNFGSSQASTQNTGFNFGATPSPVFSFGESSSSTNNTPKFSFRASQPNSGIFTPGATSSPAMPLQGVFSIGSGSTQPRSRNSANRARRRT